MKQIAAGTAPVIVDVRSAAEYDDGHVPGAIHLPFWQVGRACRAEARSAKADVAEAASMRESPSSCIAATGRVPTSPARR